MLLVKTLAKIIGSKFLDFLFCNLEFIAYSAHSVKISSQSFLRLQRNLVLKLTHQKNLNQSVPSLILRFFRITEIWLEVNPSYHTLKNA
jgi:hypothetical protein